MNYFFYKEREAMKRARRVERTQTAIYGTIFFLLVFGGLGIVGNVETHYHVEATVAAIDKDEIILRTKSGEEWAFYGDGFTVGDKVRATFFTNYTDSNRLDDEIVSVKKLDK